jgi:glucan phosphoethanolaminetransferase (alkaline phosphatase superfamily)
MYISITYAIYIILSLTITVWVATTLFRNGRVFLIDAFQGNKELAEAVNQLLLMAFYLLNIGFISLFLRFGGKPTNWVESIEYISTKIGIVLVVSGGLHFFNMWNFAKLRKKSGGNVRIHNMPIREPKREPNRSGAYR